MTDVSLASDIEILEFDNMTEFAGYVADVFNAAESEIQKIR